MGTPYGFTGRLCLQQLYFAQQQIPQRLVAGAEHQIVAYAVKALFFRIQGIDVGMRIWVQADEFCHIGIVGNVVIVGMDDGNRLGDVGMVIDGDVAAVYGGFDVKTRSTPLRPLTGDMTG